MIKNIFLVLLILFALATFTQQASAVNVESNATSSTFDQKISLVIPAVVMVDLPSEIKIENYHPDLENTEIGTIAIFSNCPDWIMASNVLNRDSLEKNVSAGTNESITLNDKPDIIIKGR